MRQAWGQSKADCWPIRCFLIFHQQAFTSTVYDGNGSSAPAAPRPRPAPGRNRRPAAVGLSWRRNRMPRWRNQATLPAACCRAAQPCGGPPNGSGEGRRESTRAAERDTGRVVAMRRLFIEAVPQEGFTQFVFVDEPRTNPTYCRRYERATGERRLNQAVPLRNGPNVTFITALVPKGFGALRRVNGAVNGAVFAACFDRVLGPTLWPDDAGVPDNLSVHKAAGLDEVVQRYGARLLYLPPYSPDSTRLNEPSASVKLGCVRSKRVPATY